MIASSLLAERIRASKTPALLFFVSFVSFVFNVAFLPSLRARISRTRAAGYRWCAAQSMSHRIGNTQTNPATA